MRVGILTTLVSFFLGTVIATVFLHYRAKSLAAIDFRITYSPVPVSVTSAVRDAEANFYAGRGRLRKIAEEAEDILTFLWPPAVTKLNLSVGPYRMKANTIKELIPWAISEGYLTVIEAEPEKAFQAISYFSEQPALAEWGASLILENLRLSHSSLRELDWDAISADPHLVAKLYSGYMGAGGDWEGWQATLEPGEEAKRRMKISDRE